ncbi:MAG: MltA domain-containing protein [bacterium]
MLFVVFIVFINTPFSLLFNHLLKNIFLPISFVSGIALLSLVFYSPNSQANSTPIWQTLQTAKQHANITKASYTKKKNHAQRCNVSSKKLSSHCIKRSQSTRKGILTQIRYLNKNRHARQYVKGLSTWRLLQTAKTALSWMDGKTSLGDHFELRPLSPSGKVKYTGYFTPLIAAHYKKNKEYRYPIYGKPTQKPYPSRKAVFNGALHGKNLEIAWVKDPIDLYLAQVQGSGILSFADGSVRRIHFAAHSHHPFISITRYLKQRGYIKQPSEQAMRRWFKRNPKRLSVLSKNPRYVFFKFGKHDHLTASNTPTIDGHTVAVNTKYIPFGSIILAQIPVRNRKGRVIRQEWRLLFAQDRGAAITSKQHLDLYTGTGWKARQQANRITGLGQAYLLVKKSQKPLRTAAQKL